MGGGKSCVLDLAIEVHVCIPLCSDAIVYVTDCSLFFQSFAVADMLSLFLTD